MAPLASYLEASVTDEIALARSAAPPSISGHAEILALSGAGYTTAIKGDNGFVCLVERSWADSFADPQFWNPKNRAPICHNRAAARTILPAYLERTGWVLAGATAWGANLKGSPVYADGSTLLGQEETPEPVTTFFVPITRWSDGSSSGMEAH